MKLTFERRNVIKKLSQKLTILYVCMVKVLLLMTITACSLANDKKNITACIQVWLVKFDYYLISHFFGRPIFCRSSKCNYYYYIKKLSFF